ncbi:serine hydrolase [Streptacidiphilus jiangxiensis]|uniref:Beta-lactamase class A n=1 Tax=Streptacidiphilus jiangxiensis TaxID=235985 RepID=A0A1H7QK92_STRJI|nr:serine hydrolase [Streptacidiphilus jiangxiensis]SEL48333.1 Beta-lactamase class A [Streptacidiphilus jiangxiensis]
MASSFKARAKRALAGGLGAVAVATLAPLGLAQPAAAATTPLCTSSSHPALAAKLSRDIKSALSGRTDTYALNVWDPHTGVYCSLHPYWHFDSASIVKATIMGALLYWRKGQTLTSAEVAHLRPMIENSDNNAATWLWDYVGRTRIQRFLNAAGMTTTYLGPGGYWGLTQVDARDEMRLLNVYTDRTDLLTPNAKAYALRLMASVESDQRWGTPYGTPAGVTAHVKNGWLPRASLGWRVNSLGIFTGGGRDYRMVVLTDNQSTMDYGINTIERVALQVHRDLGMYNVKPGLAPRTLQAQPQPGADAPRNQAGDGSAPFGPVKN